MFCIYLLRRGSLTEIIALWLKIAYESFKKDFFLCRYGHHGIAADIFQKLTLTVSSEHFYFWLSGLSQISLGERFLNVVSNKDLLDRLSQCQSHILEGLTSIRAASVPSRSQEFQVNYLKCRSEFLQALSQIVYTCHSLRTSPPPAIASSQVQ